MAEQAALAGSTASTDIASTTPPAVQANSGLNSSKKQLSDIKYSHSNTLRELPEPGTAAALNLTNDPATPGSTRDIYAYYNDSDFLSKNITKSFLKKLQQQLMYQQCSCTDGTELSSSGSNNDNTTIPEIQAFRQRSVDLLSYLRYYGSTVLLQLLRSYSSSEGSLLSLEGVDVCSVQAEAKALLNADALEEYWKKMSYKKNKGERKAKGD